MASKKTSGQLFVTAAMVAAKRADDSITYLYEGEQLPDGLADGEVDRLSDLEMVGETGVAVTAVPVATKRPAQRSRSPRTIKSTRSSGADKEPTPTDDTDTEGGADEGTHDDGETPAPKG